MSENRFDKDPHAKLIYGFDWSDWLSYEETITSACITTELDTEGYTILTSGSVLVWLSGGEVGKRYPVACLIETSSSAIDERTMKIDVKNR